ncbi:hypothetical protein [uncultured Roseibium sp.]|uniref:hypothetical protein n=1 Tax=uncultured Roseibium sp. TaxID=1936171 RepID=UPI0026272ED3|nr:hypothetical protein [uncultured Roseibium sp.]
MNAMKNPGDRTLVKIEDSNGCSRSLLLEAGKHVFGSGLDCDYMLLGPAVKARHFVLEVDECKAMLALLPDHETSASSSESNTGKTPPFQPLSFGEFFAVGDLEITVFGQPAAVSADPELHPLRSALRTCFADIRGSAARILAPVPRVVWSALAIGTLLASLALVLPTGSTLLSAQKPPTATTQPMRETTHRSADSGVKPRTISRHAAVPAVTVAMAPSERDIERQAEQILKGFKFRIQNVAVKGSQLHVEGDVPDADLQERISKVLSEDISSISEVRFRFRPEDGWRAFKDDIVAVWSGEQPYIVLKGDGVIRTGEPFRNHFTLEKVTDRVITVSVAGALKEIGL